MIPCQGIEIHYCKWMAVRIKGVQYFGGLCIQISSTMIVNASHYKEKAVEGKGIYHLLFYSLSRGCGGGGAWPGATVLGGRITTKPVWSPPSLAGFAAHSFHSSDTFRLMFGDEDDDDDDDAGSDAEDAGPSGSRSRCSSSSPSPCLARP